MHIEFCELIVYYFHNNYTYRKSEIILITCRKNEIILHTCRKNETTLHIHTCWKSEIILWIRILTSCSNNTVIAPWSFVNGVIEQILALAKSNLTITIITFV